MGHGPVTGCLQSAAPIGLGQADDALCGAQALHNLVAEQPVDDLLTVGPDLAGLLVQPLAVTGKEPLRLGWQVVGGGHALALALAARVGGHQHMALVQGHTAVGGAQPQRLTHQGKRGRIHHMLELDMAVPVWGDGVPNSQVRYLRRQGFQKRLLQRKQRQGLLACGAVGAQARLVQHPTLGLGVQLGQVAELAGGQEVAFDVLDAGLHDALLLRVMGRARVNLEVIAFGALGIRALDLGVKAAGFDDGALGVVDDDALGHAIEPLEGAAVAAQPSGHGLIPDELQVLVARVAQRHDEGPSAAHLAIGVPQEWASAKVDLGGLAGLEGQAHGQIGAGQLLLDVPDEAIDGRVAALELVLAHEGGVDGLALNACGDPAGDRLAPGLGFGDGAGGALGFCGQALGDGRHIGQWRVGLKPAQAERQSAKLGDFDAAHEAQAGNLAVTVARAQANEDVSVFMHLDLSAAHQLLLNKRFRR